MVLIIIATSYLEFVVKKSAAADQQEQLATTTAKNLECGGEDLHVIYPMIVEFHLPTSYTLNALIIVPRPNYAYRLNYAYRALIMRTRRRLNYAYRAAA